MILEQFYKLMQGQLNYGSSEFVNTQGTKVTETNQFTGYMLTFRYLGKVSKSVTSGGVVFGTSDEAPTYNDYFLKGDIITTISGSGVVTLSEDENGCEWSVVHTLTNTGESDITIKEVGYIASYSKYAMIERTVLDSPLTIPADGVGQVTYTIRMNYPTA